jgi:hypothetical protein
MYGGELFAKQLNIDVMSLAERCSKYTVFYCELWEDKSGKVNNELLMDFVVNNFTPREILFLAINHLSDQSDRIINGIIEQNESGKY